MGDDVKLFDKNEYIEILEDEEVQDESQPVLEPLETTDESGEELKALKSSFLIDKDSQLSIIIIGPDNKEITPDDIIIPPDGGWGWVILFAAFMANLIVGGTSNVSGIILLSIVNRNKHNDVDSNSKITNITESQASWIVGLLYGCSVLAGPFVSLLANKVGFRITSVCGSVLSSTGFILVYIFCRDGTPNTIVLFLFYGIIGGIGFCLIYLPSIVTVGFYFKKRRALATGIAVSGYGLGTFLYPPWVTPLTEKLGWQITILVQGTILFASVILGCLYRPLKPLVRQIGPNNEKVKETNSPKDFSRSEIIHHKLRLRLTGGSQINIIPKTEVGNSDRILINSSDESVHEDIIESTEVLPIGDSSVQLNGKNQETNQITDSSDTLKFSSSSLLKLSSSNILKSIPTKRKSLVKISSEQSQSGWYPFRSLPIVVQSNENITSHNMNFRESHNMSKGLSEVVSGYRKTLRLVNAASVIDTKEEGKTITLLLPDSEVGIAQSRVYRVLDRDTLNNPFNNTSIFYPGSLSQIPDFDDTEKGLMLEAEQVRIAELEDLSTVIYKKKCKCEFGLLKKMLDISILKSWSFRLRVLATVFTFLGFFTPFSYLPALVMNIKLTNTKRKFTAEEAAVLISIIGVTNTICRIIIGAIADKLEKHILLINNIALTVGGLITIVAPFLEEYYLLAIYSGLYGIAVACYASLQSIILVQLLGIEKLTNAFGLILLVQGIFSILGSPLSGVLRDMTGNYILSFFVAGGMLSLSGVLGYPLHYVNNWEIRRKADQDQKQSINTSG